MKILGIKLYVIISIKIKPVFFCLDLQFLFFSLLSKNMFYFVVFYQTIMYNIFRNILSLVLVYCSSSFKIHVLPVLFNMLRNVKNIVHCLCANSNIYIDNKSTYIYYRFLGLSSVFLQYYCLTVNKQLTFLKVIIDSVMHFQYTKTKGLLLLIRRFSFFCFVIFLTLFNWI